MRSRRILDDQVGNPVLESVRPAQYTFDARRVGGNDAYGGEGSPIRSDVLVHRVEPLVRHLARPRTHVGQNDGRTFSQMIDERVEAGRGVDIHLPRRSVKVVLEATSRLVLGIQ